MIVRGARQVGKTTLVREFSKQFDQFIYVNLELPEEQKPFQSFTDVQTLVKALFFLKNLSYHQRDQTLLFIDEIQEVPEAFNVLRYIYEAYPELAVIAAGSMLESLFNKDLHFPVGRVSYLMLRPVSFPEFLLATGEEAAYNALQEIPFPDYAHDRLMQLYHQYALIGGMPEIVARYAASRDLTSLSSVYDALLYSYLEDVEKYASSQAQVMHIRHVIRSSFIMAGKRIKFAGFGHSDYRSREMGEALRIVEKALLLHLVYPITSTTMPLLPDIRKSPRLQWLDTGLVNYYAGIQTEVMMSKDLTSVYQGFLIEHLTGQELLSLQYNALSGIHFWVREKTTSTAEVDFVYPFQGKLIPIETKAGAEGRLRSLHAFMDSAPHRIAIRYYSDRVRLSDTATLNGKSYKLLNLPYFLVSQLEQYLQWMENQN